MKMDSTQELIGEIKQMSISVFHYSINKKDSIDYIENSNVFFDTRNRTSKQIDYYSNASEETDFYYKNNLLEGTISKIEKRVRKTIYKYDVKKNVIEYSVLENDSLNFSKTLIYDKKNNPIEISYFYPNDGMNKSKEKFEYDYRNRSVKVYNVDKNNKFQNHYLKMYFDKKGYIITEFLYADSNKDYFNSSKIEYDKLGNLIRRTNFDIDGKIRDIIDYKNTYDKKSNIIVREEYLNKKLIKKTTFEISYW